MAVEEEVRRALIAAGFAADEIDLETTPNGNVGGFLISLKFIGKPQLVRQEELWAVLRRSLDPGTLRRIVSILTMTPDETDDDVRVASG